jgi:hypothetical protein
MKREDDRAYRYLVITLALIVAQIHNLGFAERLLILGVSSCSTAIGIVV